MPIFPHPPEGRSRALLTACNLPTADLESHHFEQFLGYGSATDLEGVIGLEYFGAIALLRSLAVTPAARGTGISRALVTAAEQQARENNIQSLYLLTLKAQSFFQPLGYTVIERSAAPEPIQQTQEFKGLCPSSAVLMVKHLS